MNEIEHWNQFSTQIKGNNSANLTKFIHLQSQTTPTKYQLIQSLKMIGQKMNEISQETNFLHE